MSAADINTLQCQQCVGRAWGDGAMVHAIGWNDGGRVACWIGDPHCMLAAYLLGGDAASILHELRQADEGGSQAWHIE